MALQNLFGKVRLWIHGQRLGIAGDPQSGGTSVLVLDGIPIGATRGAALVKTQLGNNGAGSLALAGAVVGDNVVNVTNLSAPGDVSADFESTITVAGHIQQTNAANLSAAQLLFVLQPQS